MSLNNFELISASAMILFQFPCCCVWNKTLK